MAGPTSSSWIALAESGPILDLHAVAGTRRLESTSDPIAFTELLRATRPRIAIIGSPPAGRGELEAVLAERRRRPSLRVVVVSPSGAIAERMEALRAGADEALADTIDPEELGERLAILEERTRPRHETVLQVTDDTELDLVAHQVRRGGSLIHLRPK
jgi:DNA-binding response OmpR family regulator